MAYEYSSWDALLYKSKSGGYKIKASAARAGATMKGAMAALGAAPAKYNGKISGYNPNLVRTDKELAKDLGMNVKKEEATLNALAAEKAPVAAPTNALAATAPPTSSGGLSVGTVREFIGSDGKIQRAEWDGMGWNPTQKPVTGLTIDPKNDPKNALVREAEANAMVSQPTGAKYGLSVMDDIPTSHPTMSADRASQAMATGSKVSTPEYTVEDAVNSVAFNDPIRDQMMAARAKFANDPKALAAFDGALAEGQTMIASGYRSHEENQRAAIAAAERWTNDPFRFITEPLDNFINGDPTGLAAGIAANGVGVTAGAAAGGGVSVHPGMGMPSTPPPNPAGLDQVTNAEGNQYGNAQPQTMSSTAAQIDPNTFQPVYNQQGPVQSGNSGIYTAPTNPQAPIYPTPTGASIPTNNPPGQWSGGSTPAPTQGATGTAAPTGTGAPTGSTSTGTNWWDAPGAKEALAAAGIIVGAGGSLIAANTQAQGAKEAAQIQADAAKKALDLQKTQFDQQQQNIAPWITAGTAALADLQKFDQTNPDFTFNTDPTKGNVDPSYGWRLDQGIKALENSVASRGMLGSGNTLKAITEYGQGAASQEYTNAFNRHITQRGQKLNRLQSLAGVGQTAVQQQNSAGQNYANNAGNALMGGAQSQAGGVTGASNAWASGMMGGANSIVNGLSEYYQNQQRNGLVNALLGMR